MYLTSTPSLLKKLRDTAPLQWMMYGSCWSKTNVPTLAGPVVGAGTPPDAKKPGVLSAALVVAPVRNVGEKSAAFPLSASYIIPNAPRTTVCEFDGDHATPKRGAKFILSV